MGQVPTSWHYLGEITFKAENPGLQLKLWSHQGPRIEQIQGMHLCYLEKIIYKIAKNKTVCNKNMCPAQSAYWCLSLRAVGEWAIKILTVASSKCAMVSSCHGICYLPQVKQHTYQVGQHCPINFGWCSGRSCQTAITPHFFSYWFEPLSGYSPLSLVLKP